MDVVRKSSKIAGNLEAKNVSKSICVRRAPTEKKLGFEEGCGSYFRLVENDFSGVGRHSKSGSDWVASAVLRSVLSMGNVSEESGVQEFCQSG